MLKNIFDYIKIALMRDIFFFVVASIILNDLTMIFLFLGFLYDVTGNYDIPFLVCGSIQLLGGSILTAFFAHRHNVNKSLVQKGLTS